jgi:hypothetical protein
MLFGQNPKGIELYGLYCIIINKIMDDASF